MPIRKKKLPPEVTAAEEIRELAKRENEASQYRHRLDESAKPVPPGIEYLEAVEAVIEAYDPRAIPYAQNSMEAWRQEFQKMASAEEDESGNYEVPYHYWYARDVAYAALFKQPPKTKLPPKPKVLFEQKVSLKQIALTWRLRDCDGNPDEERVEQELETPGSVITPEVIAEQERFFLEQAGFVYVEPAASR